MRGCVGKDSPGPNVRYSNLEKGVALCHGNLEIPQAEFAVVRSQGRNEVLCALLRIMKA